MVYSFKHNLDDRQMMFEGTLQARIPGLVELPRQLQLLHTSVQSARATDVFETYEGHNLHLLDA